MSRLIGASSVRRRRLRTSSPAARELDVDATAFARRREPDRATSPHRRGGVASRSCRGRWRTNWTRAAAAPSPRPERGAGVETKPTSLRCVAVLRRRRHDEPSASTSAEVLRRSSSSSSVSEMVASLRHSTSPAFVPHRSAARVIAHAFAVVLLFSVAPSRRLRAHTRRTRLLCPRSLATRRRATRERAPMRAGAGTLRTTAQRDADGRSLRSCTRRESVRPTLASGRSSIDQERRYRAEISRARAPRFYCLRRLASPA